MRFTITFKDHYGVFKSLQDVEVNLRKELETFIETWVEYDEYVTIEFDTDKNTARIVPVKEAK